MYSVLLHDVVGILGRFQASEYAGQLYDAMYAYGRSLNATLTANSSSLGDGLALLNHIAMKFDG